MKKTATLTALSVLLFSAAAQAGEYVPYVGLDYVNMTPNVSDKIPDNYDIANFNAGVKFVNVGAVELFAERSLKEKNVIYNNVSRGRLYGYGADVLVNTWSVPEAAVLLSVGYGRMSTKFKYNGVADKDTINALRLGIGGEINPIPELGLRAMYRYSFADGDAYTNSKEFSVGVRYYFQYY